jgi:[ribosomal protein S5]-alanine N-acetyltransferase
VIELARGPVVVREWRTQDAEELAVRANDRRVSENLRDAFPHPYGLEDARRFLEIARASVPATYFAIVAESRIAGGIGYTLHTDVERVGAEVGYWLAPAHWGRGLATAALQALTDHAFAAHPELRRLWAVPFATNAASARVLQKAGYTCEGTLRQSAVKDGRVLDQWVYAIVRDEWEARHAPGLARAGDTA